jgi:glycosyltransferase 2 family protein
VVRLSRRRPPLAALPGRPVAVFGRPAALAAAVEVEDDLAERVRLPADIIRCVTACVEIAFLVALALLAKQTASGAEIDLVNASRKVATGLTTPLYFLASVALLVLPVVLAVRQVVRGQVRRLVEAALIGLAAAGVTLALDALLQLDVLDKLLRALVSHGGHGVGLPLDAYLAGLVAYITVVGLAGRPRWRTAFWVAIGFYCVASVASAKGSTSVLTLLISLLLGQAVGSALRFVIGTKSQRPTGAEIAGALSAVGATVTRICRMPDPGTDNRRYSAVQRGGRTLDVTVFDRDQQPADAVYRVWRGLRLSRQVSSPAPLTVERAIEKRALMTYALEDTGVATPRLRALLRVGPEAAVVAVDHHPGVTLAEVAGGPTDEQMGQVFDAVGLLHRHRVTHRSLIGGHILLTPDAAGEVMLLDPGDGDVAATDLQIRLDLAQLTASLALIVGPERAADVARAKVGDSDVASLVPLLQPVVLHRSTRAALRRHKDVLPALRKRLVGSAPNAEAPPEQLERVRPRTVVTLVASIIAAYLVVGELSKGRSFGKVLSESDWRWVIPALALSALSYMGAAWSLSGFVLEKLSLVRTLLAQLAASFVTLATPAAVGGVAVNLRYLNKAKVEPADAAASVGVSQVFAFALHITLLIIFAALAGTEHHAGHSLKPPDWAYIAVAVVVACALLVLAFPAGRRLARQRIGPALGQVIPRLLDIAQRPAKLAEGVGGAFLVTASYILCLAASVEAVGGHISLVSVAVVYLTGSAVGSAVPTPGGLGAVEAALTTTLTAAGLAGATAFSAVILFRLLTFWLPVPFGWGALHYLQRKNAL